MRTNGHRDRHIRLNETHRRHSFPCLGDKYSTRYNFKIAFWRKQPWTQSESNWTLKIRTYWNSCSIQTQVKNHSRIDHSINNQNSKTPKSVFSKAWKENRDNMMDIISQTRLFLILNIIIKRVGTRVSNLSHFFGLDINLIKFRNIKKHFWRSKDDVSIQTWILLWLGMSSQRG